MSKPSKHHPKTEKTLGSVLRFFTDEIIVVELKNGRRYTGLLDSAEHNNMSVVLTQARSNQQEFQMVHIRGSQIRYIEFVEKSFDFNRLIKDGLSRERSAAQKYKRGVRKA